MKVIDKTFRTVYGQPCWGLHFQRNLNLSMNFGKPSLEIREPFQADSKFENVRHLSARRQVTVCGQWWLWIFACHWHFSSNGVPLAKSSSSLQRIDRAIQELEGQKLVSVAIKPETGATCFTFDLGGVLECRRWDSDSDSDLWALYKPSGYVLSVLGNGSFCPSPRQ